MNLERFRFLGDDPALYGVTATRAFLPESVHSRALAQSVRVTATVLPGVYAAVTDAIARLGSGLDVVPFVFSSPEANARCFAPDASQRYLLELSSALVQLMNERELKFVIGHELGHMIFRHSEHQVPPELFNSPRHLEFRRHKELSADRIGLLACGDVGVALSAILKTASGLGEAHLRVDLIDYLRQVRELSDSAADDAMLYSSHPPLPIRARALLRFESVLRAAEAGDDIEKLRRDIDAQVLRESDGALMGNDLNMLSEAARSAAFWGLALCLCSDGILSRAAQQRLAHAFGDDKVAAMKRALTGLSRGEASELIKSRQAVADARLDSLPWAVTRVRDALLSRAKLPS